MIINTMLLSTEDLPSATIVIYRVTSFLGTVFLLEHFLSFLKNNFGMKFKVWQYKSKKCMIVCLFYSFVFIIHQWQSSKTSDLLPYPLLAICCVYLRQKLPYNDAVINNSLDDSKNIGAYWAHQTFDSYYRIVLPSIKERMAKFEKEHGIKFLVKKLVLVIPLSCDVGNLLTDKDEKVKNIGNLQLIEDDQGANINREIKNPVYEICLYNNFYIAVEYPSSLATLWKIQDKLGKEKFNYHRDCFIKTLKLLLKDSPCIVVEYDDTVTLQEPLSSFLLSRLEKNESENSSVWMK